MCGIAAVFKRRDLSRPLSLVDAMAAVADHRGPDGGDAVGFDVDTVVRSPASTAWQCALGHRRLSIVDLSAAAAQPMAHGDRYWLTYNGEVYNHPELRAELRRLGHVFRTHSDTEVLLAAFAEWGPRCFERMRGMWALVLVDTARGTALLCRDRLGMKPLYTWRSDGMVAVVSEIKQLLAVPGFRARRSGTAIAEYLATGYQAADRSFFEGVDPVPAGTCVAISTTELTMTHPEPYWHPERVTVSIGTADEAGEAFARKLAECVRLHMRSDVPVGCSLSGGLDSSAVAVLAASHLGAAERLPTFSSTFGGEPLDEQRMPGRGGGPRPSRRSPRRDASGALHRRSARLRLAPRRASEQLLPLRCLLRREGRARRRGPGAPQRSGRRRVALRLLAVVLPLPPRARPLGADGEGRGARGRRAPARRECLDGGRGAGDPAPIPGQAARAGLGT